MIFPWLCRPQETFLRIEASIFFSFECQFSNRLCLRGFTVSLNKSFDSSSYHSACSSFLLLGLAEQLSESTSLLLSSAPERKRIGNQCLLYIQCKYTGPASSSTRVPAPDTTQNKRCWDDKEEKTQDLTYCQHLHQSQTTRAAESESPPEQFSINNSALHV